MSYTALSPSGRTIYCKTEQEANRVSEWSRWCLEKRQEPTPPLEPLDITRFCAFRLNGHSTAFCHIELVNGRCSQHGTRGYQ